MPIDRIIVVEDNEILGKELANQLRQRRYDVSSASTIAQAQELIARDNYDLMFLDLRLPDGEGVDLLRTLQNRPQRPLTVVTTGFGTVKSAVDCMQAGAFDYLTKPYSFDEIDMVLTKAENFSQLLKVTHFLSHERDADAQDELLGDSGSMHQLRDLIRKVARTDATVLIQGESGTGKELIARAIYNESQRSSAPFIRVNCAAVPESLIESEFFGHEKGAFTGALTKREGRFELAHGGTILLDEISEISPNLQAKLLRVLQEREFERIGGTKTIKVDVRVIATTNRNLQESIENGEFRQDLFFRLNVVPIAVAPLRERAGDVILLADRFMQRFARKHGVKVAGMSEECREALIGHDWPGNVRELQNVIERAVILCNDGEPLQKRHLGLLDIDSTVAPQARPAKRGPSPIAIGSGIAHTSVHGDFLTIDELEKRHILAALDRCKQNRTHAARMLNISVRTLRNKLNEYRSHPGGEAIDAGETEPETADAMS
jgi:DNA-binding NtrC family response regulator